MQNELEENQAKKLQELFAEITNESQGTDEVEEIQSDDFIEVDVLHLPPRREVHLTSRQKISLNFKKPFIRLLFVIILLLAIVSIIYFVVGEQLIIFFT